MEIGYRFSEYITSKTFRANLCYSLQGLDAFNYLLKRVQISLSAGKNFVKYAMINAFSIIDAILTGATNDLHTHCYRHGKACRRNSHCVYYIKSAEKYSFELLLDKLNGSNIIQLTPEGRDKLLKAKKNRDYVHLHLMQQNELDYADYNITSFDIQLSLLSFLKDTLPIQVGKFKKEREQGCSGFK